MSQTGLDSFLISLSIFFKLYDNNRLCIFPIKFDPVSRSLFYVKDYMQLKKYLVNLVLVFIFGFLHNAFSIFKIFLDGFESRSSILQLISNLIIFAGSGFVLFVAIMEIGYRKQVVTIINELLRMNQKISSRVKKGKKNLFTTKSYKYIIQNISFRKFKKGLIILDFYCYNLGGHIAPTLCYLQTDHK
jgi:hypothetical protein